MFPFLESVHSRAHEWAGGGGAYSVVSYFSRTLSASAVLPALVQHLFVQNTHK